jgi:hypothetical protein
MLSSAQTVAKAGDPTSKKHTMSKEWKHTSTQIHDDIAMDSATTIR